MSIKHRIIAAPLPEYAPPMPAYRRSLLNKLKKKLATLGGPKTLEPEAEYQAENDPDLEWITKSGKAYKKVAVTRSLPDGRCHWNIAYLYGRNEVDTICIGYAQNFQGWHQHTWGLKDGKLVESCPSNFANKLWYGVSLSESQAEGFCKFLKKAKAGQNFVRTYKGGPIKLKGEK